MKSSTLLLLLFLGHFMLCFQTTNASQNVPKQKDIPVVEKLDRAPNLFHSDNQFYSGQPSLGTLEWLHSEGVDLVINLRSNDENNDFTESAFNEEEQVTKLGMKYISIPVAGYDSYTPEKLSELAAALSTEHEKVLIHCASCGRVSYFMMAYLVKFKKYELSEAIEFGKQLKFTFPLEYLLEKDIAWDLE